MSTQPKELVVRLEDVPGDLARRKFEQACDARSSSSMGLRRVALIIIYVISVPIGIIMITLALREVSYVLLYIYKNETVRCGCWRIPQAFHYQVLAMGLKQYCPATAINQPQESTAISNANGGHVEGMSCCRYRTQYTRTKGAQGSTPGLASLDSSDQKSLGIGVSHFTIEQLDEVNKPGMNFDKVVSRLVSEG